MAYITEYTTDIRHTPGTSNAVADALSRPGSGLAPTPPQPLSALVSRLDSPSLDIVGWSGQSTCLVMCPPLSSGHWCHCLFTATYSTGCTVPASWCMGYTSTHLLPFCMAQHCAADQRVGSPVRGLSAGQDNVAPPATAGDDSGPGAPFFPCQH
jgi:hypothetical protein